MYPSPDFKDPLLANGAIVCKQFVFYKQALARMVDGQKKREHRQGKGGDLEEAALPGAFALVIKALVMVTKVRHSDHLLAQRPRVLHGKYFIFLGTL